MTTGLVACLAAIALAAAVGVAWRRGNGRMRAPLAAAPASGGEAPPDGSQSRISAEFIGGPLGNRATLVQFSSAFCAPCRATRRILAEVAGQVAGVAHIEIDAESRLDLVRALGVLRTPTVLVLDGDGVIVRRASGQPRKADVIAAVGVAVSASGNSYPSDRETR